MNPDFHAFCLLDLSISYPHRSPKVSPGLFIFLAVIFPILCIVAVSLSRDPRRDLPGQLARDQVWPRKLWELNAGLLGLGINVATATVICTGVKNLTGKPRPNFVERCQPDLEHVDAHTVGGVGRELAGLWVLVDQGICLQPDKRWLNDGFRSFPSGYATSEIFDQVTPIAANPHLVSFASLWYLTLYFCAKFDISVPSRLDHNRRIHDRDAGEPLLQEGERASSQSHPAARPAFMIPLPYFPLGLAIFISGTRYFDFTNHGFDVLAGAAVGACTAWLGFRWFHPALSEHSRLAWGPRRGLWKHETADQ